jgi:hypothetical protein
MDQSQKMILDLFEGDLNNIISFRKICEEIGGKKWFSIENYLLGKVEKLIRSKYIVETENEKHYKLKKRVEIVDNQIDLF